MKNLISIFVMLSLSVIADDNEIYIDQSGASANIDLEQLGDDGNIIAGLESSAGNLTPLDLDGDNLTLDINQIGGSNTFLGDIWADSFTGYFNFDGSNNDFTIQVDPSNTYGADGSDVNIDVSGSSNDFTLDLATTAMASNTDIDWIVNGDGNVFDFEINYDGATNYVDVDGDSNEVTFTGSGYAGGYFYLDQTGDSRTFDIQQLSTLNNDWLKIISNGSNGSVCIIQDDNGTAVGC